MVPLEPSSRPDLTGVDVFLNEGRTDPYVDPANAQRLADMLREAGADVTLRWKTGGHELEREDVEAARNWLSQR
jgi:predicted esterase